MKRNTQTISTPRYATMQAAVVCVRIGFERLVHTNGNGKWDTGGP